MNGLQVRPAGAADRDTAHRLLTAQLIEHRLPADPEGISRGIDHALAKDSPAWLWLAERDGRAVAVFLANQIVSVEARRTGIARALLARVRDEARRKGVRSIELEVVPTQSAAFALYRGLGFEDVHRQRMSLAL